MKTASKKLAAVKELPDVSFIENKTLDDIQAEMVRDYQDKYKELTGKELTLRRADPEALKLYAASVQIYHLHLYTDMSGKMDLLKYAYSGFLDNLGALRGVSRNPAVPATVTVRFILSGQQPSVTIIPKGTRVSDGEIYFATDNTAEIASGGMYVDVPCTCQTAGAAGNGILAGAINTLVDPVAYMDNVANTEVSSGGSDTEDDENFAYRIYLAPSSYSVAGPTDAYKYHTRSYSAAIGDVEVTNPGPGEVEVRFLLADGSLPADGLCAGVARHLSADDIRPLTDHVTVLAPEEHGFDIDFTYYINRSDTDKAASIQAQVSAATREYAEWQTCTISRDINPDELRARVKAAGAKRLEIKSPSFIKVLPGYVARVKTLSVIYGGIEDD